MTDNESTGFGSTVVLSSDGLTLAVGADQADAGTLLGAGTVTVYNYDGAAWVPGITIEGDVAGADLSDQGVGHRGVEINDDGSRLAVRHYTNSTNAPVKVYDTSTGAQVGSDLDCEEFGDSVAISPDGLRVAVSCSHFNNRGKVQVYDWNASDWSLTDTILGLENQGLFGWSTSFGKNGNLLGIGAPLHDTTANSNLREGGSFVYGFDTATSTWSQLGNTMNGSQQNGRFGTSVALSDDGFTLAIGASGTGVAGEVSAYLFDPSTTTWSLQGSIIPGEIAGDDFGRAVAISNDGSRIAGSSSDHDNVGHTLLFDWDNTTWIGAGEIAGDDATESSGWEIDMSGDGLRIASSSLRWRNADLVRTGLVRVVDQDFVPSAAPSPIPTIAPSLSSQPSQAAPTAAPSIVPVPITPAPSAEPVPSASIQPSSDVTISPTQELGKFEWDLERIGSFLVEFDAAKSEEVGLVYNISLREAVITMFQQDCNTTLPNGLVEVTQSTKITTSTHGELDVMIDIKQDSVVGSPIWRDGSSSGSGFIDFCVRVDLTLPSGVSVNFHEQVVLLSIGLSQGFVVNEIELEREIADEDAASANADYGIEACQCNTAFECESIVLVQGDDAYICVFTEAENVEIAEIEELDFTQGSLVFASVNNRTESVLSEVTLLGKKAVIRSQLFSEFFTATDPDDLVVTGSAAVKFVNDTALVTRSLRTVRQLQEETTDGDEESADFEVMIGLLSSTATTVEGSSNNNNKAGKIVAGIFGGIVGVALVVIVVIFVGGARKKKRNDESEVQESEGDFA